MEGAEAGLTQQGPMFGLPADIIKIILAYVPSFIIVKLVLTAKLMASPILSNTPALSLTPRFRNKLDLKLMWTGLLSEGLALSSLTKLELLDTVDPDTLGRMLQYSPVLRELSFIPRVGPAPLVCHDHNRLCVELRRHQVLQMLSLHNLSPKKSNILPYLPGQLTSFRCLAVASTVTDQFFSDLVNICPHLSTLNVSARYKIVGRGIAHLKRLLHLNSLYLSDVDLIPHIKSAADCRKTLDLLETLLPTPPNKSWKVLNLGFFSPTCIFTDYHHDVPLLREMVRRLGVAPEIGCLRSLSAGLLPEVPDESQLEFMRLLFEETKLRLDVERCDRHYFSHMCDQCEWFRYIPLLRPQTASFLIEGQFLPYIAERSKRTGESPDTMATRLLGFQQDILHPQCEETVLNYIRTYNYPLDVDGAHLDRLPLFLNLRHGSARDALVWRASALGLDLGLANLHDVSTALPEPLLHAATLEPRLLLQHLAFLTSVDLLGEVLGLARDCRLDTAEKLRCLSQNDTLFSFYDTNANLLMQALSALLPPEEMKALAEEFVMREPMDGLVLATLLQTLNFDHLRTTTGKNWLHFQLKALLDSGGVDFDRSLLAGTSATGKNPLHSMFKKCQSAGVLNTEISDLKPYWQFIEEKGLWDAKDAKGRTPLQHISFLIDLTHHSFYPEVAALIRKHLPEQKLDE